MHHQILKLFICNAISTGNDKVFKRSVKGQLQGQKLKVFSKPYLFLLENQQCLTQKLIFSKDRQIHGIVETNCPQILNSGTKNIKSYSLNEIQIIWNKKDFLCYLEYILPENHLWILPLILRNFSIRICNIQKERTMGHNVQLSQYNMCYLDWM